MNKDYLIYKLSDEVKNSCKIPKEDFTKYGVKRGLRNEDGSGVLVGLTNIGNVVGYERGEDGVPRPCEGKLIRNYKRAYPNGSKELLHYAVELFEEMIYG